MAALIFNGIIETNLFVVVALNDQPMNFLVRMNGRVVPIQSMLFQMNREAVRVERGPLTA